ncbi:MAG: flagellar synthesis regulator FleN [Deltaproteobacteria bacterium CG23_combo_of_CG06-09_8_20_14_all_60_8]|nr:MAG: flagellar synthesis regulator FleN [Deltaproteobacteria bacterium CG23_combo_of_CG06-09_8_20_14_all_60_8]
MNQAETLKNMPDAALGTAFYPASPRVICITSGKGGVGKTNVAVNLAYGLRKKGKRVLLLDADLNLANIDVLLGLTPRYNLHNVFLGEKTLRDILIEGPAGMHILPASSGIMEMADLSESQKLSFMTEIEVFDHAMDYLLIDTGAGINNNVVYFNLAARERIVVLSPEPTSLTDAYALIKVLALQHDVKSFRILINSAQGEKEAIQVFRKLSLVADRFLPSLSLDFLGHIPFDSKLPQAVRKQRLVSELFPEAAASRSFLRLAQKLVEEKPEPLADGNIKFFWQGLFDL